MIKSRNVDRALHAKREGAPAGAGLMDRSSSEPGGVLDRFSKSDGGVCIVY